MREVKNQDWGAFCETVNAHEGNGTARVTIEVIDSNGGMQEIARQAAFQEMHFGKRDGCNDQIVIRNQDSKHEVVEPIRVLLRETENGAAFNSILIEAENGSTVLTFHPVIRAQWLEQMAR